MEKHVIHYQKDAHFWADLEDAERPSADEPATCYIPPPIVSYEAVSFGRGIKVVMTRLGQSNPLLGHYLAVAPNYGLGKKWREPLNKQQVLGFHAEPAHEDDLIATAPELADVLNDINNLAFQDVSDEFGLLRPSFHAFRECLKSILSLARELELLRPSEISTDRNGDIRITWASEDREAELVFPSDENSPPYLYHSSPASYDTEFDISPKSIDKLIRWAMGGR